ncbi:MAG: sulfotransferase [Caldilineaceae bacterium]|nr:sulfotransferase [Caldilineaceae bacterium]
MNEHRPIFIIGAPRSGTTLLRLILDAHPHISCGPETGFLVDLAPIVGRHWQHLALYGFEQSYWIQKMARFFAEFQESYAQQRGKRRWAEKTPQYTPHLAFIRTLFPASQIVHIIRDGRDVMSSYLKRWGYRAAWRGIQEWQRAITIAQAVGRQLPASDYYELRYEALVQQPEATIRGLLTYLQEPWNEKVLHYLDAPHDLQATYRVYTGQFRTAEAQAQIYDTRVGAWQTTLPFPFKVACQLSAGPLLKTLGYC